MNLLQLDKLREEGGGGGGDSSALSLRGSPAPKMEAGVLLHNIQRIIQVRHTAHTCIAMHVQCIYMLYSCHAALIMHYVWWLPAGERAPEEGRV